MKDKPLVSFLIVFYNQENFAKEAIEGALSQDYENLEIILSDDGSKDNTIQEIQKAVKDYKGPHKIIINKNDPNLGISKHFNKLIYELSHGDYIVFAGGDDVSHPSRVSNSVSFLENHPNVQSVTYQSEQCDVNMQRLDSKLNFCISPNLYSIYSMQDYCNFSDFIIHSGDSRTLRRSVADFFPPLSDAHEEDLEFFVRSFLLGQVGMIYLPMVKRRNHTDNTCHKPKPLQKRIDQHNQMLKDAMYAYEKGVIDDLQYEKMKKKIDEIFLFFCETDKRASHKIIYRGFSLGIKILKKLRTFFCRF